LPDAKRDNLTVGSPNSPGHWIAARKANRRSQHQRARIFQATAMRTSPVSRPGRFWRFCAVVKLATAWSIVFRRYLLRGYDQFQVTAALVLALQIRSEHRKEQGMRSAYQRMPAVVRWAPGYARQGRFLLKRRSGRPPRPQFTRKHDPLGGHRKIAETGAGNGCRRRTAVAVLTRPLRHRRLRFISPLDPEPAPRVMRYRLSPWLRGLDVTRKTD